MEINEKQGLGTISLPLPIYESIVFAEAKSGDGEEFEIAVGLSRAQAEEIKKYALDETDEELQKNTSDKKRFGENSYDSWYAKDRTPFVLVHKKSGAIAAFVWFGPEPLSRKSNENISGLVEQENTGKAEKSNEWHTIGYRSYKPFRGKGLMKDFTRFAIKIYSSSRPGLRYWAGIHPDNKASIALAEFLGFVASEENSDRAENWLVMIK